MDLQIAFLTKFQFCHKENRLSKTKNEIQNHTSEFIIKFLLRWAVAEWSEDIDTVGNHHKTAATVALFKKGNEFQNNYKTDAKLFLQFINILLDNGQYFFLKIKKTCKL